MSKRNSERCRRICRETHMLTDDHYGDHMFCHVCKGIIRHGITPYRADHWPIAKHLGGRDEPGNLWPICLSCDGGPGGKAAKDKSISAKVSRLIAANSGPKRPGSIKSRGFQKPPPGMRFNWKDRRYVKAD